VRRVWPSKDLGRTQVLTIALRSLLGVRTVTSSRLGLHIDVALAWSCLLAGAVLRAVLDRRCRQSGDAPGPSRRPDGPHDPHRCSRLGLAGDAVTGFVAGVGAGGIVAMRADVAHSWKARAVAVLVVCAYVFILAPSASVIALLLAPVLPFTSIGVADHLSERRGEREARA
jgi:hypothetical protein